MKNVREHTEYQYPPTKPVEVLRHSLQSEKQAVSRILLATGTTYEVVEIHDIICCTADKSYTLFHLVDSRKIMVTHNLKEYEDLLPENSFIRVHHSTIINLYHVKKYVKGEGGYVVMSNKSSWDVSRRKKQEFLDKISTL